MQLCELPQLRYPRRLVIRSHGRGWAGVADLPGVAGRAAMAGWAGADAPGLAGLKSCWPAGFIPSWRQNRSARAMYWASVSRLVRNEAVALDIERT